MDEVKMQAMLAELEGQRNWALTRCATLSAEIATLNQRIQTLTEQAEKQAKELEELRKPTLKELAEQKASLTKRKR